MGNRKEISMKWSIYLLMLATIVMTARGEAAVSASSGPTNITAPKVIGVWPHELALGKEITVKVSDLYAWSQQNADNDPTKLIPLINGHKLSGLYTKESYFNSNHFVLSLDISEHY